MKKIVFVFIAILLLMAATENSYFASAETNWYCAVCNVMVTSNHCDACGAQKSSWTCVCGQDENFASLCSNCGNTYGENKVQASFFLMPQFHVRCVGYLETSVYKSAGETDIYLGDYEEDVLVCAGCNLENTSEEKKSFTITATYNDDCIYNRDFSLEAGETHGFYVEDFPFSQPGEYQIKWYIDGVILAEKTFKVREGESPLGMFLKNEADLSVRLVIYDDEQDRIVCEYVQKALTSLLGEKDNFNLFIDVNVPVNFLFLEEKFQVGVSINKRGRRFDEKTIFELDGSYRLKSLPLMPLVDGENEVVCYINGVEVLRTNFYYFDDANK